MTVNCSKHGTNSTRKSLPDIPRPRPPYPGIGQQRANAVAVSFVSLLMSKSPFEKERARKEKDLQNRNERKKGGSKKQSRKLVHTTVHMTGERGFVTTVEKDVSETC